MIKVLEHGVKKVTCPYCKAKLEYELRDVFEGIKDATFPDKGEKYTFIICPDCGVKIVLTPIKQ